MNKSVPVIALTKCGIGIFDLDWWVPRLGLFKSVTLPSVLQAAEEYEFHWFMLLDEDMPTEALEFLRASIDEAGGKEKIHLQFVRTSIEANRAGLNAVRSVAGDNQRALVIRIDDDDAVSRDAFTTALNSIEDREHPAVISLADGYIFDAPGAAYGDWTSPNQTSNTYYYGTLAEVRRVIWHNHTKALFNAKRFGYQSKSVLGKGRHFLYTVHRQADGSYEERQQRIQDWSAVGDQLADEFALDIAGLNEWQEYQRTAKPTLGLTWRRSMPETTRMRELFSEVDKLKHEIVKTNSAIFDPKTPFLYLLDPAVPPASVKKGKVRFRGVATPGTRVNLSVAGNSLNYKLFKTVEVDDRTGEFDFLCAFNSAVWNLRLEVVDRGTEKVLKKWEFKLTVR